MYSKDNYIEAKAEVEARRTAAITLAEERNRELAISSPEIRKIDEELRLTGLELFRTACSGGNILEVRKKNERLVASRRAALLSLGLPEDYTEVKYTCSLCSDTGFVGTKMCSCLKELLITKNIKSSGMGKLIERQSFDNFSLKGLDGEDLEKMKETVTKAREYAKLFPTRRGNLLLIGTTGTGKTHISTAIAKEIIHQGFDVLYDSIQNIISDFEADKFKSGYGQNERISDKYLECDLLIIDDLGTEFDTQFSSSTVYNLLNTRQNRGLSTIISTNLSAKELAGKYEGRICSRIIGSDYEVLSFRGSDYRIR